jgi:CRISPR-associated endonuclease/helicase Cas3
MSDQSQLSYYSYWGKLSKDDTSGDQTAHLLPYHCLDVAAVGKVILEENHALRERFSLLSGLSAEDTEALLLFFLALHDIGKFSVSFQNLSPDTLWRLQQRKSNRGYQHRHDAIGLALWNDCCKSFLSDHAVFDTDDKTLRRLVSVLSPLADTIFGHHGYPVSVEDIYVEEDFSEADIDAASLFARDLASLFVKRPLPLPVDRNSFKERLCMCSWLMSGLSIICDWIGSDSAFFGFREDAVSVEVYWQEALGRARSAVEAAGILPVASRSLVGMGEIFPRLRDVHLSPLQTALTECEMPHGPQLWIIEDITGSGKTEAALILTHRLMQNGADGLFVALPTMATSNAMYERLSESYRNLFASEERPSLVLAHGKRRLSEGFTSSVMDIGSRYTHDVEGSESEASAECSRWIADNRKKAFLGHVGIGTIDQALLGVLPSKHHTLRLFGLSSKVLIVDEVHACDAYMAELLKVLLRFHASFGGSAILLSATIPGEMRRDFTQGFLSGLKADTDIPDASSFPVVTSVSAEGVNIEPVEPRPDLRRSIEVKLVHDTEPVINEIIDAARSGATVCWIRNTVADAVEAYEALQGRLPASDSQVMLFHARFAAGHRLDRELEVLACFGKDTDPDVRKGKVLVATQVVEQSLDLDFDFMVSDLAPIDLLIQRAGRVHRHSRSFRGNRTEPALWVLCPPVTDSPGEKWFSDFLPGASYVYPDHGKLWRTARLIAHRGGWTMPDHARELIEGVYNDDRAETLPDDFETNQLKCDGETLAAISRGKFNALDVGLGYGGAQTLPFSDSKAPTRLGEPSVTFRLAERRGDLIKPLCEAERHSWALSEIQVRESKIAASAETDEDKALAAVTMSDKGKWSELIILNPEDETTWAGTALKYDGSRVSLTYSLQTGLHIHEGS